MAQPLVFAVYVVALAAVAAIDVRTLRAPNRIVLPMLGVALLMSLTLPRPDAIEAGLGALLAFGLLFGVALFGRGAMGMGDVKYGTLCGAAVGLHGVLPMLAFTFVFGGAVALLVLVLRIRTRQDVVAFTPFLFAGVLFSAFWSPTYLVG
ncbi:MAG: prepilin peptidase [Dehalococcoidia bacterium]